MEIGRVLDLDFFEGDVVNVARRCIGIHIVAGVGGQIVEGRVVEAEAYRGPEDRAAHSFANRRTARTEVMFGPPGRAYVFQIYGQHFQLNAVTAGVGCPQAVLIRALEPIAGVELMAKRRGLTPDSLKVSNGPGKLCQALGVDKRYYGWDLTQGCELYFTTGRPASRVMATPRIGIASAKEWAKAPWRFIDVDSRYLSQPAQPANSCSTWVEPK